MFIANAALDGGGTLLVLGLSRANRERMEHGQPIRISRETHGLAVPVGLTITIFAGDTEESMRRELQALIDPMHTVIDQKKEN